MFKYVITTNRVFSSVFNDEEKAFNHHFKLTRKNKYNKVSIDKVFNAAFYEYVKDFDFNVLRRNAVIGWMNE